MCLLRALIVHTTRNVSEILFLRDKVPCCRVPGLNRLPSGAFIFPRAGVTYDALQGGAAPDFPFAELYGVTFLKGREFIAPKPGGRMVGPRARTDTAWLRERFRPDSF